MSLESVRRRVGQALDRAGRPREAVRLVVISKGQPVGAIRSLFERGQFDFGENRAQELDSKVGRLPGEIRWHFVGPLQTNKARVVRGAAALLHSLDRPELAAAWMKGPGLPPPALLQVNVGREPQKHGVDPEGAVDLARRCIGFGVDLIGLMAIPPLGSTPEDSRPYFRALAGLGRGLRAEFPAMVELSMGMSDDFEVAIEEGATLIRVGRAIFSDG